MASLPASAPANSSSIRLYTAEEWEQKRMIITQLYRDEARPLHAVQLMLFDQGKSLLSPVEQVADILQCCHAQKAHSKMGPGPQK
jgi:hypothetical protein